MSEDNTREKYDELMNMMKLHEILFAPNIPSDLESQIISTILIDKLKHDSEICGERPDTVITEIKDYQHNEIILQKNNGIRFIRSAKLGPKAINYNIQL